MTYRNLFVVIVLAGTFAFTLIHARGPAPKPASAAGNVFSADRAAAVLSELVGDGVPHPLGSPGHAAVRDRIVQRLRALGYQPAVESGFACSPYGICAETENVTAVVPGSQSSAVMVAAHYDSVPAGPGASDDGAGIAALLEVARILSTEPPRRNPIVLLFDDGEEAGLLGAESFVARSPWARRVAVVVNVDARGTRGESFMFETTAGHRWLIDLMARNVPRPDTSSLFYEVYKRLPNDTDFTVFKRAGKEGVNFAYLGDVSHYHTPLDDLSYTSRRSLQHHGDNILGMARALAESDLGRRERGDLVWFDLMGLGIIRWPVPWSLPMALACLLFIVAALILGRRKERSSLRSAAGGFGWFAATLVIAGAGMAGILAAMKSHFGPAVWPAHPEPLIAAAWLAGLIVPISLGRWLGARVSDRGLVAGAAVGWALFSVVTASLVPGASYLFLPVAILLSLSLLLEATALAAPSQVLRLLAIALSAAILFPLAWTLYDALGLPALAATALLVALASTTWGGMVASWSPRAGAGVTGILAVLFLASASGALTQSIYSPSSPQRLNILLHVDADAHTARFLTGIPRRDLPPKLSRAARWTDAGPFPWYANASYSASRTPAPSLSAPEVTLSERPDPAGRRLLLRLHSVRGANSLVLNLHDGGRLRSARVGGWQVTPFSDRYRRFLAPGWTRLVVRGGGDGDFDLVFQGSQRVEAVVEDQSYGLPASASRLVAARGSTAVPSDSGDLIIVTHAISF
jgi:hypothetical protein